MSFKTKTELMKHQVQAVSKMLPSKVGALFMEMGTGKSLTLIKLACIRCEKWDNLFWFCPVALKETILNQILEHTDLKGSDVCVWGDKVSTKKLPLDKRIHIIGIESMSSSNRVVAAYKAMVTQKSFVAVDESGFIKSHKSNRADRITHLSDIARYRLIMTGTPITQGVSDLYAQMRFLSPKILGYRSFYTFARNHLEFKTQKIPGRGVIVTNQICRVHDTDMLAAKIAPYVYQVRKSECLELPTKIQESRFCSMTSDQKMLYEDVKKRILYELQYSDWSPVKIFHLFTALQTVLCGWYTDPYRGRIETSNNRLELLKSAIHEIPNNEKVIVWAKYRSAVDQITSAIKKDYGDDSTYQFFGELSEKTRNEQLSLWREKGRFLIATQAVGGHGLTLNEASYAIFYADGFKFSERLQAEDRCHRIGQKSPVTYITLRCRESIDDRIAAAISRKGGVLASFMSEVDSAKEHGMKQRAIDIVRRL